MASCIAFQKGTCNFGEKCNFVHDTARITSPQEPIPSPRIRRNNVQESSATLPIGKPAPKTNQDATTRKFLPKARGGFSQDDRMLKGLDSLIKTIDVEPAEGQDQISEAIKIKNYESIASYSWKDSKDPIIYVPGHPPRFTPPIFPIQLPRDNLTKPKPRSPASATDPLFQALLHQHPNFSMSPIDLVTDRNSLRNLLSFASKGPGKWRIEVDMIHNTMFFNQWEEFRLMLINGNQDSGYGHAFEEAVTRREAPLEDSIHHERIVRYELGGLQCLVRFEADAYINDEEDGDVSSGIQVIVKTNPHPPYKLVKVLSGGHGHTIPAHRIAELKSKSTPNPTYKATFNLTKTLPQLWFAQTKYMCVGHHTSGLVTQAPEMQNMTSALEKWETSPSTQEKLKNMIRLIREIRELVKRERKCTLVCSVVGGEGVKCLRVFRRTGGAGMAIRPEVLQQCWSPQV